MIKVLLSIFFSIFVYVVSGQIITDRPDQTESPISVQKGGLQIESGILLENIKGKREMLLPTTLLRIGLGKSIELRVLSEYESYNDGKLSVSGIGDIELGAKIWLAGGDNAKTNIGLISHLKLPTGSEKFTTDEYGSSTILSIDHDMGKGFGIGYNFGFHTGKLNFMTYTLAIGYDLNSKVGLYIEPYGEYDKDQHVMNVNGGFTYLINNLTQLDFSIGTGLSDRYSFLSLGFSTLIK